MASVKEIAKSKVEIEFEITEEAIRNASLEAYQKNKGKFNIPGFRKGHAPKHVIETYYGQGVFFEDAFEIAFPAAYRAAIEECGVFAVSRPENVDIVSMEPGKPMVVKAEVYVRPEVELGDYKGVTVEYENQVVTDEEIEKAINRELEENARFEDVEREAQNGDKVVLDYAGSIDGVPFDGGTAEAQTLDLGSKTFIPGFEEQVVGMKAGEEKDINVKFPESYHAKELAGKDAVFAIKLISVKEKHLPEADDDFAQDVSDFDTFADYKADVVKKLEARKETTNRYAIEDLVIGKVVENAKVDIPECMIDTQVNYQLQELEYSLMYQGLNLKTYMEYTKQSEEDLRKQYHEPAERQVKTQLVLDAIKKAENMEVTEDELDNEMKDFAERQNKSLEDFKKDLSDDEKEYMSDRAMTQKVIDFLVDSAKVKKPAKKKEKAEKKEDK